MEHALGTIEATEASPATGLERQPELAVSWVAPEPLSPDELRGLLEGDQLSENWEKLVALVARTSGALDVAVGEGLAAMCIGDRLIRLGFSCLGDFAREVLGMKERRAQVLAHLARELVARPLLRDAVRAGEVSIRKAESILPVARGDAEATWVERARTETVRALEAAVREARVDSGEEEAEWTRVRVGLSAEERAEVDEALSIAGKVLLGSTRYQRLEAMAQEYLAGHPAEAGDDGGRPLQGAFRAEDGRLEGLKARLEAETERWACLLRVPEFAAPDMGFDEAASAREIEARLRELAAMRDRWDSYLGYGAFSVKRSGLWRALGFASFSHYCDERLGLAARTVEQRVALERRLWELPALRAARDSGLSYEKVRLLSRLDSRDLEAWLARARGLTVVALRRELEDHDDRQMRAARVFRARVPARVGLLLAAAFRAVRAAEGRLLSDGKCLVIIARHFIETWSAHGRKPRTRSQKVRDRDAWCTVPGCSRPATQAHHVDFRARGGGDEAENQTGICPCHHLRGVHGGYLRVWGRAPHGLIWELGGRVFTGSFGADGRARAEAGAYRGPS